MKEQGIDDFQFDDPKKQALFETLTSKKRFPNKDYTEEDLQVDLVLRMQLPFLQPYGLKVKQYPFQKLFKNLPPIYEQMYTLVQEYINYLVELHQQIHDVNNPVVRQMTSIHMLKRTLTKKRKLDLQLNDPVDGSFGNTMKIDCNYGYEDKIDIFSLRYNMIMVVLQQICGFRVRTFILEDQWKQSCEGNVHVHFLLSMNTNNLLKLAHHYKIKKELNMGTIDFEVNNPIDSSGRPLKANSIFKHQEFKGFREVIKKVNIDLGLSNKQISVQINDQIELNQKQIAKFEEYFQELEHEVSRIFPPKHLKDKMNFQIKTTTLNFNTFLNKEQRTKLMQTKVDVQLRLQRQSYTELQEMRALKKLSKYQQQYLYIYNRQKMNPGCYERMITHKRKKYLFNKIIEINKKYGYQYHEYNDCFVDFVIASKKRPFFQKLDQMLQYQYYNVGPYGQISLFNNMQRIKLSFLNLQEKVKLQNLGLFGIQMMTINNQYQKFGDKTLEYDRFDVDQEGNMPKPTNITFLKDAIYQLLPFRTNIRVIRDYMGDNFAFQIAFKIHTVVYLFCMIPIAIGLQVLRQKYFQENSKQQAKQYIKNFLQLVLLYFSLVLFIEQWKKKQTKYFNNYLQEFESGDLRSEYRGPYIRNILNDTLNYHKTIFNVGQVIKIFLSQSFILLILVLEVMYFWVIRRLIIFYFQRIIHHFYIIAVPHLIFYSIFFISNHILFKLILKNILGKVASFQNIAKISQHQDLKRKYQYYFLIGLQLIGPLYFFIIQNFNGSSCYAANCAVQFQHYVVSRYIILAFISAMSIIGLIYRIFRSHLYKIKIKYVQNQPSRDIQRTFQYKLSQLLRHIQFQQTKTVLEYSLQKQMGIIMFFSIFFIRFPFNGVFAFITVFIDLTTKRFEIFYTKRRPIPQSITIYRYSKLLNRMYFLSILVNSWSMVFNHDFMQYDLKKAYGVFVTKLSQDNMLTCKLITVALVVIFFLSITFIFQIIAKSIGQSNVLQKRKMHKFKQFLIKARGKPQEQINIEDRQPLKTIFRTFQIETVIQYKKNKFNFLKKKFQSPPQLKMDSINNKPVEPQPEVDLRKTVTLTKKGMSKKVSTFEPSATQNNLRGTHYNL